MATNERMANRSSDDGRYVADNDPRNILEPPTGGEYLCSVLLLLIIFSVLKTRSARGVTSMIQKRLDKLKEI